MGLANKILSKFRQFWQLSLLEMFSVQDGKPTPENDAGLEWVKSAFPYFSERPVWIGRKNKTCTQKTAIQIKLRQTTRISGKFSEFCIWKRANARSVSNNFSDFLAHFSTKNISLMTRLLLALCFCACATFLNAQTCTPDPAYADSSAGVYPKPYDLATNPGGGITQCAVIGEYFQFDLQWSSTTP